MYTRFQYKQCTWYRSGVSGNVISWTDVQTDKQKTRQLDRPQTLHPTICSREHKYKVMPVFFQYLHISLGQWLQTCSRSDTDTGSCRLCSHTVWFPCHRSWKHCIRLYLKIQFELYIRQNGKLRTARKRSKEIKQINQLINNNCTEPEKATCHFREWQYR